MKIIDKLTKSLTNCNFDHIVDVRHPTDNENGGVLTYKDRDGFYIVCRYRVTDDGVKFSHRHEFGSAHWSPKSDELLNHPNH